MTVGTWLRTRSPAAPPRLAARVEAALGGRCDAPRAQATDACLEAANELLLELLHRPSAGRESALDLLSVDALMTYAFEAAASEPATLCARADVAMARISDSVNEMRPRPG